MNRVYELATKVIIDVEQDLKKMKQVLLLTCILWATLAISDTYDSDSLFLEANELYNNQNYAQAIDIYRSQY